MHDPSEMPARLAAFLAEELPGASDVEVEEYEVMTGGYSRLLARATVHVVEAGERRTIRFVLRGDPPADRALIQTDRRQEWEVLQAVQDRVRVPRARHFDETGERLGTPAIVLDHATAVSLLVHTAGAEQHGDLPVRLAEAAASFHTIPVDDLPPSLVRPPSWDVYLDERIHEWRRADRDHGESEPFLRFVAAWLDAHRPPPVALGLIHGDFQSANLMVDEDGHVVVLDWELAQIGDPREDLGYFRAVASAAGPDLIDADADAFCARYRELTGMTEAQLNPTVIAYFFVLGVIGTVRRLLEGADAYARGENRLLASLFNLSSIAWGHGMWLQVTDLLEGAMAGDGTRAADRIDGGGA